MTPQDEQAAEPSIDHRRHTSQPADENDDDAPMVYVTPKDYRASALRERDALQAQGREAVLMSELPALISRRPNESDGDYVQRYSDTMNDMVARGVQILHDQCTADAVPDRFSIGGHEFDAGPNSGITKKEYRELTEWLGTLAATAGEDGDVEVPEQFRKYEVAKGSSREI